MDRDAGGTASGPGRRRPLDLAPAAVRSRPLQRHAAGEAAPIGRAPSRRRPRRVRSARELRASRPGGSREPAPLQADPAGSEAEAEWPGFRGPERDGVVRGVRIETDWSPSPPVEMWRRPIGPGWSSFAVDGDRLYTQEQRGEDEIVACYDLKTGEPVWRHRDAARFWESNAGAGPRGTPTLSQRPRLHVRRDRDPQRPRRPRRFRRLVAQRGDRHRKADPDWGFASSPLVVGDLVVVAAAGWLAAYDAATGEAALGRPEPAAAATARRSSRRSTASRRSLILSGRRRHRRLARRRRRALEARVGRRRHRAALA